MNLQFDRRKLSAEVKKAIAQRKAPVLVGAMFAGQDFSGLDFTSLFGYPSDPRFKAIYNGSDFRNAKLKGCCFQGADLASVNFRGTDLSKANLENSNPYTALFQGANLTGANLRGANLHSAELHEVILKHADVTHARFGLTSIAQTDLSLVKGLEQAVHIAPSPIDAATLRRTAAGLADASDLQRASVFRFLSNAGIDDELLQVVRAWIGKPIEFYSVFVSHSSLDKEFARKLYSDLRALGVRCWFDEHEILPGDNLMEEVDRGIRMWDKMLLICSENSLRPNTGWWVEQEIERALKKERESRKTGNKVSVLLPVTIDNYVFSDWEGPTKATILARHVGDFREWRNHSKYAQALNQLRSAIDAGRRMEMK